jgi:hypothetical protein
MARVAACSEVVAVAAEVLPQAPDAGPIGTRRALLSEARSRRAKTTRPHQIGTLVNSVLMYVVR